ncbi:MAG: BamA/TamA family outer membrane protein [Myxococcaceae bacterium]|nr:BamA/TamA family outer membrane protein [Myxococcaceae bacterium]
MRRRPHSPTSARLWFLLLALGGRLAAAQADVKLLPVAAPAYTPELGFILAAGGVMTWNGDVGNVSLPRSSLTVTAGAGTVGAFLLQTRLNAFVLSDSVRFLVPLDVRDQPDHYFGVGLSQSLTRALGADTTAMRRTWWNIEPTLLRQVAGPLYVGAVVQISGTHVRDASAGVLADQAFQRHGPTIINTGVGLTLQVDTRDVPINAWKGLLVSATLTGFGAALGANTTWYALTLDYRQYLQLGRPGSTLAWQVKYRAALGDAPWSELTQVGTPFDLRAYRWGQHRERTGVTALLEYRFMLPFPSESLWSHLGAAAWLGVGALSSTLVPDFSSVLPAAGVGLRVELLRRVTVRLDVGFGRESRAVYFNFLEAF